MFLARPKFHYTIVLEVLSSDFRLKVAQKCFPKFGHYYLLIFAKIFAIILLQGKGKRKTTKKKLKKLKKTLDKPNNKCYNKDTR